MEIVKDVEVTKLGLAKDSALDVMPKKNSPRSTGVANDDPIDELKNNFSLPGREKEMQQIYNMLTLGIETKTGSCLCMLPFLARQFNCIFVPIDISGVPGTGKTATVRYVLSMLRQKYAVKSWCGATSGRKKKRDAEDSSNLIIVELNGLTLTDPKQSYIQFYRGLMCQPTLKVSSLRAIDGIEAFFKDSKHERDMVVLLIDELDVLVNSGRGPGKMKLLYQYFEWATRPASRLLLITIANRMDLIESSLHERGSKSSSAASLANRLESRLGLARINFLPYNYHQLLSILRFKLEHSSDLLNVWKKFDRDAVELCAKKVSTISGDVRKAIEVCKRALEIHETSSFMKGTVKRPNACSMDSIIPLKTVHQAITEMYSSLGLQFITTLPFLQKIFLASLLKLSSAPNYGAPSYSSDNDVKTAVHLGDTSCSNATLPTLFKLFDMIWQYCRSFNLPIPSLLDLQRITVTLLESRLILLQGGGQSSISTAGMLGDLDWTVVLRQEKSEVQRILSASNEYIQKILVK